MHVSKKKKCKKVKKAAKRERKEKESAAKGAEPCPGGKNCAEPKKHLCRVAKQGDIDTLRELARGAAFICAKCGRSARSAKSLCRPVEI